MLDPLSTDNQNNPAPNPVSPAPQFITQPSHRRIVTLILVLLLLGAGGVFAFWMIRNNPQLTTGEAGLEASPSPISDSEAITAEINKFVTYTSPEYGFTLLYPSDWTVKGFDAEGSDVDINQANLRGIRVSDSQSPTTQLQLEVVRPTGSFETWSENLIENQYSGSYVRYNTRIGRVEAVRLAGSFNITAGENTTTSHTEIYLFAKPDNSQFFILTSNYPGENESARGTFAKIVDSITFSGEVTSPAIESPLQ